MVFMTNIMKVIKDKYVTNCARHTKVEFDNKNFRRFYFGYKGALYGYILSSIINFFISIYFVKKILKINQIHITFINFFSTFFQLLIEGFFYYFGNWA